MSFLAWGMILLVVNILLMAVSDGILKIKFAVYFGYACWLLALLLWILAVVEMKRNGGIHKGGSYINTTRVVDTGIFSLLRHPQYLGYMLLNIGIILIVQNWMVAIAGILSAIFLYLGMKEEEHLLIEIFGDKYREYMTKVARLNVFKGLF